VDETDAPESPTSPKRNRREDLLSELATKASERWKRIREMITDIKISPNRRSNSVEPANPPSGAVDQLSSEVDEADDDHPLERVERTGKRRTSISQLPDAVPLPDAAVQLSSPASQTELPFPFVGRNLPERFNCDGDHRYWNYMGREKFTELLDAVNKLETMDRLHGYLFYGTIGYGKSHLLAALACYLIAAGKRVIYIPDCRACAWSPATYFRTAMLLAWGGPDDNVVRESIKALDDMEAIAKFFKEQSNILFLVDQVNILEKDPSGTDGLSDDRKSEILQWIMNCVDNHRYIFSASANNRNRGLTEEKQTNTRPLLVYGGFSPVSLYTRYITCRLC
jgi:hypothetical protein